MRQGSYGKNDHCDLYDCAHYSKLSTLVFSIFTLHYFYNDDVAIVEQNR